MKRLLLFVSVLMFLLLLPHKMYGDLLQNLPEGDLLSPKSSQSISVAPSASRPSIFTKNANLGNGNNMSESLQTVTKRLKRILRRAAEEAAPDERDFIDSYIDVLLSNEKAIELYIGPCKHITSDYIKSIKTLAKRTGYPLKVFAVPGDKNDYRFDRALAEELKGLYVRYLPVSEVKKRGITEIPVFRTPDGTVVIGTRFDYTGRLRPDRSGEFCRIREPKIQPQPNTKKAELPPVLSEELNRHLQEAIRQAIQYRAVKTVLPHTDDLTRYTVSVQEITGRKVPVSTGGFLVFARGDIERLKDTEVWNKYPGCCVDCTLQDTALIFPHQMCTDGILKALKVKTVPSVAVLIE